MAIVRVATVQGGYGPPVGNVRVVINRVANVYGGYCPGVARVRVGDNQVATVRVAHFRWLLSGWHVSSWLSGYWPDPGYFGQHRPRQNLDPGR